MLTHCVECQKPVSTSARHCPHCGSRYPWPVSPAMRTVQVAIVVVAVVLFVAIARSAFQL